jgi:hypothetical protein
VLRAFDLGDGRGSRAWIVDDGHEHFRHEPMRFTPGNPKQAIRAKVASRLLQLGVRAHELRQCLLDSIAPRLPTLPQEARSAGPGHPATSEAPIPKGSCCVLPGIEVAD